jgi:beta-lactamase class A
MRKILFLVIALTFLAASFYFAHVVGRAVKGQVVQPAQVKTPAAPKREEDAGKRKAAWAALKKGIEHELKGFSGVAGVVVKDLDKNWEINANKGLRIPSASMVKIPIMMSYFYAANEKKLSLQDAVEIRNSDKVAGSGALKFEMPGKAFTIEELIGRMITESDNTAANMLINRLGLDSLNAYFKKLGLKNTNLSRKMMDFKERKQGVENYTTVGDISYLLEQLYRGRFLNAEASRQCIEILARQKMKDRIPKKLPAGIIVAHKTGLENFLCHDAGIVYTDKGNFLIAVLTKHRNRTAQEAKSAIADISLLTYNYYGDF